MKNIEHYLKPGAIVPVNNETTKALVDALKEAREALAGAEGERQPERSDDRERSDREQEPVAWLQFRDNEPPVVAPRDLGTPVFLGIRGGLAYDAGEKP